MKVSPDEEGGKPFNLVTSMSDQDRISPYISIHYHQTSDENKEKSTCKLVDY